jgi:16S rRNA (guanine527-N7)-methyltransferase
MQLEHLLARGVCELALDLPKATQARLLSYVRMLDKWNRTYNLTAVRDPEQMVPRHLLDSLSILPFLGGARVADIGTGAGLPGIPLALARDDLHFTLIDSNSKKIRFVRQAVHELKLKNVVVLHERVEEMTRSDGFPVLVARAFDAIPDMLARCRHLAAPGGRLLAMKGVYPQEEIAALEGRYGEPRVESLTVPGLDAARHLVMITLE